jgi:hypothetical protein
MKALKLKQLPSPYERDEQAAVVSWAFYQRWNGHRLSDHLAAVPNGTYLHGDVSRRAIQGDALRRQGVKAGYPDLILDIPIAPYHGARIEMKRIGAPAPKDGDDQAMCHARLRSQGYYVAVAFGFEQAKDIILNYLEGGKQCAQE